MSDPEENEEHDDAHERGFVAGMRAARVAALRHAAGELGYMDPITSAAAFAIVHLEQVRACLRRLCSECGDNDWPDDLHLVDVIEKHLLPNMRVIDEYGDD